jgi:hypothetical protein
MRVRGVRGGVRYLSNETGHTVGCFSPATLSNSDVDANKQISKARVV